MGARVGGGEIGMGLVFGCSEACEGDFVEGAENLMEVVGDGLLGL